MNNSYITIIKEKRTVLSRKRVPLNQNECTADFRIGVPFEQNLHTDFVDNTFNGSISDLLVSLTYNTKLSESDIEELKNIINNNTCD